MSVHTNPLHAAAAEGNIDLLAQLLKKGKCSLNDTELPDDQTPLHVAAYEGQFDAAYWLITHGADVNKKDNKNWTPLHCSAVNNHLNLCVLLLTRGADPNAVNFQETSPLHYIIRSQYSEELIEVLNVMIEHGVNLECKNKYLETPLLQAASKGQAEAVRFLIDHGADVNTKNKFNQTALHLAVENGNKATVLLLLKNGAKVDATADENLGTPIDIAIKEKKEELLKYLKTNPDEITESTYDAFVEKSNRSGPAPFIRQATTRFIDKKAEEELVDPSFLKSSIEIETKVEPANDEAAIVGHYPGFKLELGKKGASNERKLLFVPENYKAWFYHSDHFNYVGKVNKRGSKDTWEPLIISILPEENRIRINLWSRLGDVQFFFPQDKKLKGTKYEKGIPKEILNAIKSKLQEFRKDKNEIFIFLEYVKQQNLELKNKLLEFEAYDPLRPKCFSIGVLYSKSGQTYEDQQFNNEFGSPAFDEFLNFLGDRILTQGWLGYRGDLDVKTNTTGKESLYRRWKGFELMFHVSTMLPYAPGVDQQLHRKRRIGNDIGVIVFQDGGVYVPPIRSQFLHAYWVVSPKIINGKTHYKFQVALNDRVPDHGPDLPDPPIFEKNFNFRDFLLTRVINGLLASLQTPSLRDKIWCKPKEAFLVELVQKYAKTKTVTQGLKAPGAFD